MTDAELQARVREIEQMTENELQIFYSRLHLMHGKWNANHNIHEWTSVPIHPGSGVSISRCIRCGKPKYTNGETSPMCAPAGKQ